MSSTSDANPSVGCAVTAHVLAWLALAVVAIPTAYEYFQGEWRKRRELAAVEAAENLKVERKARAEGARQLAEEEAAKKQRELRARLERDRQRQLEEQSRQCQVQRYKQESRDFVRELLAAEEESKKTGKNAFATAVFTFLLTHHTRDKNLQDWRSHSEDFDALLTRLEAEGILEWPAVPFYRALCNSGDWDRTENVKAVQNLIEHYEPNRVRRWRWMYLHIDQVLTQWEAHGLLFPGDTLPKWQAHVNSYAPELLWKQRQLDYWYDRALHYWESRGLRVPPNPTASFCNDRPQ